MIHSIYTAFQSLDPLVVSLISLVFFFSTILVFFRLWGETGLYAYISVAIIGANFQVLKISYFGFLGEPVALGTVLFASTYLCTDILSEHYGQKSARRGVMIGFGSMVFWTAITQLTLGYAPLTPEQAGEGYSWALGTHAQMEGLFSIFPNIFIAGVGAYLISQLHDVYVYEFIKKRTNGRFLWLRNNLSTIISSLIDNFVFSFIAFWLLADEKIEIWPTLIVTYVLGTYLIRVAVAVLDTPFIYLTKLIKPVNK